MCNLPKCLFTIFCIILFTGNSQAENKKVKFGKVSKEELEMKVYKQDTSAAAVILYDSGASFFETQYIAENSNFVCVFQRHVRIKILKTEGFDFATFRIPFYEDISSKEEITSIKARTYNLEEKVVVDKLERQSIFTEESAPNWKTTKFTMPNIKEGSVIDCKYTIRSPYYQNFRTWQFQYKIPVLYSKYCTRIPEYFRYQKTMKGYYKINAEDSGSCQENFEYKYTEMDKRSGSAKLITRQFTLSPQSNITEYYAENIPSFKPESYMLAEENYMSAIEFELQSYKIEHAPLHLFTSAWKDVQRRLTEHEKFGVALKRSGFTKDILTTIINPSQGAKEKTSAIFHFVKNTIRWDNRNRVMCSKSLRNVWEEKSGSSADINLLLIAMLRSAGLNANPVVLSTRQNGIIHPTHPTITQMNYVIACVEIEGNKYLMDATDPYCPIGILPFRCLNGKGRIITNNHSEWIDLEPTKGAGIGFMAELSLTEDGVLKGKMKEKFYDYSNISVRKKIANNTDEYTEKLESDYEAWNISDIEYLDIENTNKPLQFSYSVEMEGHVNMEADRVYINPILKYQTDSNPFKLEKREYPVNFGHPFYVNYIVVLNIPDNYIIEEKPKPIIVKLPEDGGSYIYQINKSGNKILFSYKSRINKSQFLQTEYAALKEFYNQIITKEKQVLVLKKLQPTTLKQR